MAGFEVSINGRFWVSTEVEMQRIIEAEKSDIFDVLAHVANALPTLTREERAPRAMVEISTRFNSKQRFSSTLCCRTTWMSG